MAQPPGRYFSSRETRAAFALYGSQPSALLRLVRLWGLITDNLSWRWVFYINVPVGAIALLLVYQLVEDSTLPGSRKDGFRVHFIGFSLLTVGVVHADRPR